MFAKKFQVLYHTAHKFFKTPLEFTQLLHVSKSLASALLATRNRILDTEEINWIRKIETLRGEMLASDVPLVPMKNASALTGNPKNERVTTIGQVCRNASKPSRWALLLFKVIREFKPENCLELGTCLGISGCYQAVALKLNSTGKLVTIEGAESRTTIARENFRKLGLENIQVVCGPFQDTLFEVLKKQGQVDYTFIDGHHDGDATVGYLEAILPFLSKKAVVIFDDISWSKGMKKAWNVIISSYGVSVSVDLFYMGICVFDKDTEHRHHFKIVL